MQRFQINQINEILNLLGQAHVELETKLSCGSYEEAQSLLGDCQDTAVSIGEIIEASEGENAPVIQELEEYCECVYRLYEDIDNGKSISVLFESILRQYKKMCNAFVNEYPVRKQAIFLPYKASMWDSLETVWERYMSDEEWDAIVIPIPYFDKKQDGTVGEMHYELDQYPENVPVMKFDSYDFEQNHPEEIFIHNPYDNNNFVTSVHPFFYSSNLKKYTDKLIYIPYFVLADPNPKSKVSVNGMAHFAQVPGVVNADDVRVQSENMRLCYIEAMVDIAGEESRPIWEKKISVMESPKIERLKRLKSKGVSVPEEWKKHIENDDGTNKKVVLYNTSVTALMNEGMLMIEKMSRVFEVFKSYQDSVVLIWRPHPLIEATISSMRPELWNEYKVLLDKYRNENLGIYDDSADLDRALVLADAYYGDESSLVQLCKEIGTPVMIQNTKI